MGPGETIDRRYLLQRPLGRGGLATTFMARDLLLERVVTIKILEPRSATALAAFRAEFVTLQGLAHPRLVQVHDFGSITEQDGGRLYYTASYLEGRSLAEVAPGRRWQEVQPSLVDAIEALRFLHGLGIRHGDFKPDNIIVDPDGRGTLIDLSCSQAFGAVTGNLVSGSPGFLAPEVLAGGAVDHRADLFAVGVLLQRVAAVLDAPPPTSVTELAAQLTRQTPSERPSDAVEVLESLGVRARTLSVPRAWSGRLVGRQSELRSFEELLSSLSTGAPGPRALYVHGPEGIGKSHFVREVRWSAQRRGGIEVLQGHPQAAQPLVALLRIATEDPSLSSDVAAVLRARDRLVTGPRPVLLLLEDVDRFPPEQADLLWALVRTLETTDALGLVCTGVEALEVAAPALRGLGLTPLDGGAVAELVAGTVHAEQTQAIVRLTGGVPSEIVALLEALTDRDFSEQDLERVAGALTLPERRLEGFVALTQAEQTVLGLLVVLDGRTGPRDLDLFEAHGDAWPELVRTGWVVRDEPGWKLARASDVERLAKALPPAHLRSLHRLVAERRGAERAPRRVECSTPVDDPSGGGLHPSTGAVCHHLAAAGALGEASECLLANLPSARRFPRAFQRAAVLLSDASEGPDVLLAAAEIQEAAGDPWAGLSTLAKLVRTRPGAEWRTRIDLRAGSCSAKLGATGHAIRRLRRAWIGSTEPTEKVRSAADLSLALLKKGDPVDALAVARDGLERAAEGPLAAELCLNAGIAASYVGDVEGARAYLDRALALGGATQEVRARVRAESAKALLEHRAGNGAAAAQQYRAALELAEQGGLNDLAVVAALNYGAACHQIGDWGPALLAYETGVRLARALGMTAIEVTLRFNSGKLHADIGEFERGDRDARRAREAADRASMRFMAAASTSVLGEIALAHGHLSRAREELAASREAFEADGAAREVVEVDVLLGRVAVREENLAEANERWRGSREAAIRLRADDLRARVAVLEAELLLRRGASAEALGVLEQGLELARGCSQRPLEAEIESQLGSVLLIRGARSLAERRQARARELWERLAASLPPHVQPAFWRHPLRRAVPPPAADGARPQDPEQIRRLRHLLAINKRLNSAVTTKEVLGLTMDAAIELTSAERGFLILAPWPRRDPLAETESGLEVAIARNLDREMIGRSHLKFSRSIAEKVVARGDPIMTVDAQSDDRFATEASVHAMRLKSVLCVPIRTPAGVQGALYLDNRFREGGFGDEDLSVLSAFADQVAIALTNARLLDELQNRSLQLEAERQRVQALLDDKAAQVERLHEELASRHDSPTARRHEYEEIVGRSSKMREVFQILDRVVDSSVSVLIQGESGTGKELVARAIHNNGDRRDAPFVAVNCAALPETLLEAELFGYERGSFTGATRDHTGLIATARGGTLFLDELGEMSAGMQVKLLRVLQEREVRPLGSSQVVPVDVRLLCATNRKLRQEVQSGRFREDLYYRVAVVEVVLPPLRDRPEDIAVLTEKILERVARNFGRTVPRVDPRASRELIAHPWPGNVRQLENVLTRACLMAEGDVLRLADLALVSPPARRSGTDRAEIVAALEATEWNVREAALRLSIPRATFYRKLRRYELERPPRARRERQAR